MRWWGRFLFWGGFIPDLLFDKPARTVWILVDFLGMMMDREELIGEGF
jgi:hypothetical protein